MMECCACGHHSGRMEICPTCARMVWPHKVINPGAKQLKRALLPVNNAPVPAPVPAGQA